MASHVCAARQLAPARLCGGPTLCLYSHMLVLFLPRSPILSLSLSVVLPRSHHEWLSRKACTIAPPPPPSVLPPPSDRVGPHAAPFLVLATASTALSHVASPLPQPSTRTLYWPLSIGHDRASAKLGPWLATAKISRPIPRHRQPPASWSLASTVSSFVLYFVLC